VAADVSKREDLEALIKATTDKWGQLDVLVNNAGGRGRCSSGVLLCGAAFGS